MEYTLEVLDRSTGETQLISSGDWITVTELGQRYGVGPKRVRAVLHHMGLLRPEGIHGRYRLAPFAVERGYGKRIDKPKKGNFPFDTLSPKGQQLIDRCWAEAVIDLEAETTSKPELFLARHALNTFKARRDDELTTQMEVCWLLDFFALTYRDTATVLGVSEQLVGRYADKRTKDRDRARKMMESYADMESPTDGDRSAGQFGLRRCQDRMTFHSGYKALKSNDFYSCSGGWSVPSMGADNDWRLERWLSLVCPSTVHAFKWKAPSSARCS